MVVGYTGEPPENESVREKNAATIGAVVGAAAGAALGYAAGEDECRRTDYQCMSRRSGAVVFGLSGFVLGAGVGAWIGRDRVRASPLDQISVAREAGGNIRISSSARPL
jgi:hypothetical protein